MYTAGGTIVDGLVGGAIKVATSGVGDLWTEDTRYLRPGALPDVTTLFWMSGVHNPSGTISVGWKESDVPVNMIGIQTTDPSGVCLVLTSQGYTWKSNTVHALAFNPTMFVARVEFSGASPYCYLSVDGSGWNSLGAAPLPFFSAEGDDATVGLAASGSVLGSGLWYDEVALWGDTPRFTTLELQQLYELGKSRRVPLPEYTNNTVLSHSGHTRLFTYAMEPLSASGDLYAKGHIKITAAANAALPYFPAITGWPYPEKMAYYLTGNTGEELVAGQTWTGTYTTATTSHGSGFAATTSMECDVPEDYRSTLGKTNFTWHLVTRNLLKNGGLVNLDGNPGLRIDAQGIHLYTQTKDVAWSGAPASGLYSSIQDNAEHVLVANVTYAGGTSWLLNVSKDGRPFTSYGLSSAAGATPPALALSPTFDAVSLGVGVYVDEIILWYDVDFTPAELAFLGHCPSGTFAYHDMFLANYVPPATGGWDFTIESLLCTSDHRPQIIGKLDVVAPETVNIEVWACTSGNVTPAALTTSGCYPIGDTGRWGWSTANIQDAWPNRRPQYFYRMRSTGGNIFEGVFFLSHNSTPRGMPRSTSAYIKKIEGGN